MTCVNNSGEKGSRFHQSEKKKLVYSRSDSVLQLAGEPPKVIHTLAEIYWGILRVIYNLLFKQIMLISD
jgi:hypothetical protein